MSVPDAVLRFVSANFISLSGKLRVSPVLPPLILFFLCAVALQAQTTIKVPADQPTIQAGIDAAQNGDTVLVSPGTYYENIDFKGKAITVISSDGPAKTTIDGGSKTAVVLFHSNESRASIISGFTIQHGGNNTATLGPTGGVVTTYSANPSILNNIIVHNLCYGIHERASAPLIQNNEINFTDDPGGQCGLAGGSAIYLDGGTPGPQLVPTIVANVIENNTQSGTDDAGGNGGAGIAAWTSPAVIEDNIIRNNATAEGVGGGVNFSEGAGSTLFAQNLVYGNSACGGGGVAYGWGTDGGPGALAGLMVNNTIANNTTNHLCSPVGDSYASQVYIFAQSSETAFVNNLIVASDSNPAVFCDPAYENADREPTVFDHNDVFSSSGTRFAGICPDQTGSYGNISADPQFVNTAGNDYHLKSGSPAVDTGNNSALQLLANAGAPLAKDLDGNPRIQDGTGVGYPIVDMGAYEFAGTLETGATTLVLTPSAYEVSAGNGLTLSAKLVSPSGMPSGTVTFFEDGNQIGASSIDATGVATLLTNSLVPGLHVFLAKYPGQGSSTPAVSVKIYVVVDKYGVSLKLTSTPNPSLLGQSVTFTATISSADGVPPGTITLGEGGTVLATLTPDANGVATYSTSSLTVGTHYLVAHYAGDSTHVEVYGNVEQVVTAGYTTTTSLASSLNPANAGQSVTFNATVSSSNGTPGGSVMFTDGGATLGTQALTNGVAAFTTSALGAGTHAITAAYSPSGSYSGSSASLNEIVNGAASATSLTASPNPGTVQQAVTLTATVTPNATGTVTFYDGASALGSATVGANGVATYIAYFAIAGDHNLTASYGGNGTLNASRSSVVVESILTPVVIGDFSITAAPGAASVYAGSAAKFTVAATPTNGFNQTLSLACSNLPAESDCAFSPASVAGASGSSVLIIHTTEPHPVAATHSSNRSSWPGALAAFAILLLPARLRRRWSALLALFAIVFLGATIGCGAPPPLAGGTPPGAYDVLVTATASQGGQTLSHSTTVELTVKSIYSM